MAIGNTRGKIGKDRARSSGDIPADRQTDRQTDRHTCSSQYFATAPAGEVIITVYIFHSDSANPEIDSLNFTIE